MYRKQLAPDAGMLFLFERPEQHTFWMHNTLVPLDMIFITADWTVLGIVENATPLTDRRAACRANRSTCWKSTPASPPLRPGAGTSVHYAPASDAPSLGNSRRHDETSGLCRVLGALRCCVGA